jgi:GNAT superfamily N-acetyltransferase
VDAVEAHRLGNALLWRSFPGARVDEPGDLVLYISGLGTSWANGVVAARLLPEEADERIAWAVDQFEAAGVEASWSTGPLTTPADLADRLLAHGFHLKEDLPWMAADLAASPLEQAVPPELVIEEVRTPKLHDAWVTAMVEGFESDDESRETLDRLGRHELEHGDGSWVRFVGFLDGRPVASSGLVQAGGVAGIYNVTTLRSMRRRGFGTAMSLAATRRARDLGHRLAVLGASDDGRGVYERLGFRGVCVTRIFEWKHAT